MTCRLRAFVLGVAYAGIGVTAIVHPNDKWTRITASCSIAFLAVAAIKSIAVRSVERRSARCCAICGWSYLALAFLNGTEQIRKTLVTEWILDTLFNKWHHGSSYDVYVDYAHAGHAIWAVILGMCAASIARWYTAKR